MIREGMDCSFYTQKSFDKVWAIFCIILWAHIAQHPPAPEQKMIYIYIYVYNCIFDIWRGSVYLQRRLLDQGCSLEEIKQDYPLFRMNFPPHGIAKGWRSFERKKIVHPLFKISVWACSAQKEPIEKNFLKIIDFGLSCKYTTGQVLQTKANFSVKRVACSIMNWLRHHDIMFYQFLSLSISQNRFMQNKLITHSTSYQHSNSMMLRLELHITWHHKCCKGSTIRLGTMIERYCHPSTCVTADGSTRSSQAADLWSCGVLLSMFALVSPCEAKLFWIFQSATELICWFGKGRKHWPKILGPNDFETSSDFAWRH